MGRPPKDNLRFATDRELQEMQRVLRGWDRVATLREALLLPDAPNGPSLTETERVVDAFFEGQLADALAVAVARPGRPLDPEEVLARFAEVVTERTQYLRLEMMHAVVDRVRRTGERFDALPDFYRRLARASVHPLALAPPEGLDIDSALASVLDAEDIRDAIRLAASKGARAALAALQGKAVSALENDLKRLREAARNSSK